jgi:hypothetical protein
MKRGTLLGLGEGGVGLGTSSISGASFSLFPLFPMFPFGFPFTFPVIMCSLIKFLAASDMGVRVVTLGGWFVLAAEVSVIRSGGVLV